MAGLMLYLYEKGIRNFLFFVNSNNIIKKTKDNFFNPQASKNLFNDKMVIDGKEVYNKETDTFESADTQNIHIKFTTIQELHIEQNNQPYGFYFEPIQDTERNKSLAFQKGKIKRNRLHYYAIKLDANCYVITGGAIKMSQSMQNHPDTYNELKKMKIAKAYLILNGVFDENSFYELFIEQK